MRILSIHVNGFSKLVNFDYKFDESINEIIEDNGYGKTSIMEFITAMLFGLDNKKRTFDSNDKRTLYKPWNSSSFGGEMVIEVNNKRYRIERSFGKDQKNDIFNLYDLKTNLLSYDYSKEIGKELFGFDVESFKKSIYLPEQYIDYSFDDNLEGKLAALVSGLPNQEELQNIDIKIKQIDDELKKYKKGNKDNYYNEFIIRKEEIKELLDNLKIDETKAHNYQESIDSINNEITELNKELGKVSQRIASYQKQAETNVKLDHLEEMNQEIFALNDRLEELHLSINNTIPTENDLNNYENKLELINKLRLKEFNKPEPVEEIKVSDSDIKHYQELIDSNKNFTNKKINTWFIPSLVIAFIVVVIGIIAIFVINQILGIILMALGLFVSLLLIYLNQKNNNIKGNEAINKIIEKFFFDNGIIISDNYQDSLNELKAKKNNYDQYIEHLNLYNELVLENNRLIEEESEKLLRLLSRYRIRYDSFNEAIKYLKDKLTNINFIKEQINNKVSNRDKFILDNGLKGLSKKANTIDYQSLEENRSLIYNLVRDKTNEISIKQSFIDNYKEHLDEANDYNDELAYLNEEISKLDHKKIVIEKYKEYIVKAINDLKAKYVFPVRNNIKKYLDSLNSIIGDFELDINFKFYGKEPSGNKELCYYSLGTKQLIGLSLRLALIDSLYDKDKPFVILDDSFVNFDQKHLDKVKIVINELSKNYQVLYFTCHSSRSIK